MEEVYVILLDVPYEGSSLIGVFDLLTYAKEELNKLENDKYKPYGKYRISKYKINKCYDSYTNRGEE